MARSSVGFEGVTLVRDKGATRFTELEDTPASITADQFVRGNAGGTDLEFVALSSVDHGGLGGLTDDDHTQYILVTGARAFTGGQTIADATDAINSGAYSIQMDSGIADGAAAIAYTYDTVNALPTDGAKMCSWLANGVEQAWMTADGALVLNSTHIGVFHETQIGPDPIVVNTSPEQDQLTIFKRPTDQSGVRRAIQAAFEYDQAIDRTSPSFGINCFVSYDGSGGNSNSGLCVSGGRYGMRLGANFNTGTINRAAGINVKHQTLSGGGGVVTEAIGFRCESTITSGSSTTDYQTVRGAWFEDQSEGSVRNQGIWMEGEGADGGGDITFGAGEDAQMYYDGTDFIIDPDLVGTGRVLVGATGDDDVLLNSIEIAGRIDVNPTTVTSTTHTAGIEHVILCDDDAAGAAITVTLPTAATADAMYRIKKLGSTASVTIDGNGAELIDDAATAVLTTQYESIDVVSDGSAWWVL